MTRPTCETCLFFSGGVAGTVGTCHRRVPAINPGGFTYWPIVSNSDWCAEHSEWADYEEKAVNEALQASAGLGAQ
jgi:hypothetical protein